MARIVEVRASAYSCPLENYRVRLGLGTKRDIVLVRITDESGAVGFARPITARTQPPWRR